MDSNISLSLLTNPILLSSITFNLLLNLLGGAIACIDQQFSIRAL
jgi:hypothetical protein